MELMYIKYKNNIKSTVIKDGDKLIKSESKIIPLRSKEKINESKNCCNNISNEISEEKINEQITNFFFNAVHKNYLANKKNF
ncbi:hypothetical protein FDB55_14610 [Clostridium botulinum]|uniref:Uncharacterized protein n=1 Tax=Clostridium botulinum TaxID=1491 RepID=A0A0L9Y5J8_CLOBO|nr:MULTISPECIES: hypothetical protein [Clostridium]ACD53411.1 hypothetical protein CLH_2032 [Clostridium botulinum E3 str. Alaska E43]AJF29963.1 hypothetical protein ST13_09775 [Clostridium botulinum]AJF33026.1 hypothetical protein ST12_09775 [Clostridium botulinum]KOM86829.1 hypothetical protein ACP51_14460 [Clostridium botulinum]KOR60476.1 hypothetical protein ADT22_08410 [Clostridium botulinum]